MYHLNPHYHHLRIGAQWFSFSLVEKFPPCGKCSNHMCPLRAGVGAQLCLVSQQVFGAWGTCRSDLWGTALPVLKPRSLSVKPWDFFSFCLPNAEIIPGILRWMEFLFLAHSSGNRGVLCLDSIGAEVPSAAIFRPSCVWERVARFRTRLFVYSYQFIHKLWYCLPRWHPKALT